MYHRTPTTTYHKATQNHTKNNWVLKLLQTKSVLVMWRYSLIHSLHLELLSAFAFNGLLYALLMQLFSWCVCGWVGGCMVEREQIFLFLSSLLSPQVFPWLEISLLLSAFKKHIFLIYIYFLIKLLVQGLIKHLLIYYSEFLKRKCKLYDFINSSYINILKRSNYKHESKKKKGTPDWYTLLTIETKKH